MFYPRAPEVRSKGHGKRIIANTVDLLEALEIPEFRLTAQAVGKYLWANCGFDFDPGYAEAVNLACAEFAVDLGLLEHVSQWGYCEHAWDFQGLNVDEAGNPVYVTQDALEQALGQLGRTLDHPLESGQGLVSPSKLLLVHADYVEWRGTLGVGNLTHRAVLDLYTRPYR
jgi:hypothetical protein